MKRLLFVNRKPPFGTSHPAELMETVLIAAAFDQEVHLAFLDDGVFQLLRGQGDSVAGRPPLTGCLAEWEDYDIDQIWVERQSLEERGLAADDLAFDATVIDRTEMADLLTRMDMVFSA